MTVEDLNAKTFWVCQACSCLVYGSSEEAKRHFLDDLGCYSHRMFEFAYDSNGYTYRPTGREIHTSDSQFGLCYLTDYGGYPESAVYEFIAKAAIKRRLEKNTPVTK